MCQTDSNSRNDLCSVLREEASGRFHNARAGANIVGAAGALTIAQEFCNDSLVDILVVR